MSNTPTKKRSLQKKKTSAADISGVTCQQVKDALSINNAYTQKQICQLLGLNYFTSTKQRIAQKKAFQRLFEFEEEDKYLIVTNIYNRKQPKLPRKTRTDSIYSQYIEYLLMNYLMNKEGYTEYHTNREWWYILNLVNVHYRTLRKEETIDFEWLKRTGYNIDIRTINYFRTITENISYKMMYNALNLLSKKSFIHSSKELVIVQTEEVNKKKVVTKHLGNDEEWNKFLTVQRDTYDEFNNYLKENINPNHYDIETDYQIRCLPRKLHNTFYSMLNSNITRTLKWDSCYVAIKIVFTKNGMKRAVKKNEKEIEECKKTLNSNCMIAINTKIINDFIEEIRYLLPDEDLYSFQKKDINKMPDALLKDEDVLSFPQLAEKIHLTNCYINMVTPNDIQRKDYYNDKDE